MSVIKVKHQLRLSQWTSIIDVSMAFAIRRILPGGRFKLCLDLKRESRASRITDEGNHGTNPRKSQQDLNKVSTRSQMLAAKFKHF